MRDTKKEDTYYSRMSEKALKETALERGTSEPTVANTLVAHLVIIATCFNDLDANLDARLRKFESHS